MGTARLGLSCVWRSQWRFRLYLGEVRLGLGYIWEGQLRFRLCLGKVKLGQGYTWGQLSAQFLFCLLTFISLAQELLQSFKLLLITLLTNIQEQETMDYNLQTMAQ